MADSPRREAGRAMRRKLMGDAYANKLDGSVYRDPIMEKFAEVTQETIFGTLWTRPGLDPKVRRLLVLAMTASLGRWEEFRLHLRVGLAGGLELTDLEEVLLQVAIYAGVPAANTGFHFASEK